MRELIDKLDMLGGCHFCEGDLDEPIAGFSIELFLSEHEGVNQLALVYFEIQFAEEGVKLWCSPFL
jgi:hypothetical protein